MVDQSEGTDVLVVTQVTECCTAALLHNTITSTTAAEQLSHLPRSLLLYHFNSTRIKFIVPLNPLYLIPLGSSKIHCTYRVKRSFNKHYNEHIHY